jgi:uncharacterized protein YidB (DUF937 family)
MSPMTMALLGLLAYKAMQHFGGGQAAAPGARTPAPGGNATPAGGGGGLGDILGGLLKGTARGAPPGGGIADVLGGLLGGGAAARAGGAIPSGLPGGLGGLLNGPAGGAVLSGGLASVIKELQNNGHGHVAQSWVDRGENQEIEPDDLAKALGSDSIDAMIQHTGMPRDELLEGLSQQLPQLVDHLTPDGRLPTEAEASRMI